MPTGLLASEFDEGARGQALAATCSGCHSAGNEFLPDLKRFSKAEVQTSLLAFKSGARASTLMSRLASGYTDAEIEWLAETVGR